MQIINVIKSNSGCITTISSYPILQEKDKQSVVKLAEAAFLQCIRYNGIVDDEDLLDDEDYLEEGIFEVYDYSVALVWSDLVIQN
jgi:hypothetical protein